MQPKTLETLLAIRAQTQARGFSPTLRELADLLNVKSQNTIRLRVATLEEAGLVEFTGKRSLRLTEAGLRTLGALDSSESARLNN